VDRHRFDADPNPDQTYHFDADPNPDTDATPSLTNVGKSEIFLFLLTEVLVYIALSFSSVL
jgi:hypothetical protein